MFYDGRKVLSSIWAILKRVRRECLYTLGHYWKLQKERLGLCNWNSYLIIQQRRWFLIEQQLAQVLLSPETQGMNSMRVEKAIAKVSMRPECGRSRWCYELHNCFLKSSKRYVLELLVQCSQLNCFWKIMRALPWLCAQLVTSSQNFFFLGEKKRIVKLTRQYQEIIASTLTVLASMLFLHSCFVGSNSAVIQ